MDSVIGVSWPRSGHHLLVRLLTAYFGEEFKYCDFYKGVPGCCKTVPCTRSSEIHLTKNHDFTLDLPQIAGRKYLIQYRDFPHSVVSNYELMLRATPDAQDTLETFCSFASEQFAFYVGFLNRWVRSDFARNQLVLTYDQLIAYPQDSLRLAVWWLSPDDPVDMERIASAVTRVSGEKIEALKVTPLVGVGVHANRELTEFRHYDATVFAQLARLQLTRNEVRKAFQDILGRDPAEKTYLHFQGLPNVAALESALRRSEEYRQRMASQERAAPDGT